MKKIVLFGDSITAGRFIEAVSPILVDDIKKDITRMHLETVEIINAGSRSADTTEDGLKRLQREVLDEQPDIVTIFFGANDVAEYCLVEVEQYINNLNFMVEQIGHDKVILITPSYMNSDKKVDRPQERLQEYQRRVKQLGRDLSVPVVDLYKAMCSYPGSNEFLQVDGLHFSKVGYELLSALIVQELKSKLKKN